MEIVIVGGGFAGVAAGLELIKNKKKLNTRITLIDKNTFHLFTPSLYEVATSEEPQGNIAIPYKEIFDNKLTYLNGFVEKIDPKLNIIYLRGGQEKHFDYLILALGSQPAYFSIPGLKDYSIPLKALPDALKIREKIRTMCCKGDSCKKKVQVVIGGGGFSGTELAAELLTYKNKLSKQYKLSPSCLAITIIQGSNSLLKELDQHVSQIAQNRISQPNVQFCFGGHITQVTDKEILTDTGKSYPYDIFIWTGGVEANSIAKNSGLPTNKRGQVIVNQYLQTEGFPHIFAIGDIAGFVDSKTQSPVPTVAQVAEEQGKIAAKNVRQLITKEPILPYPYRHFGYVVPLRGHYASAELMGNIHIDGFFGWILQQLVFLRYLLEILPPLKAILKWNSFEQDLTTS